MQKIYVLIIRHLLLSNWKIQDQGLSSMENLLDEESHMISTDYIDEVSSITNSELERLLDKEMDE